MKFFAGINMAQCTLINESLKKYYINTTKGTPKPFKITLDDAVVLDYIRDLFPKQNMEKLIITASENEEVMGMSFVWIDYKNMMEQLPMLNLGRGEITEDGKTKKQTFSKMGSDKVTKLIDLGLLYKITTDEKAENGGKKTYLAPTELAELIYEKVSNNDEEIQDLIEEIFKEVLNISSRGYLNISSIQYNKVKKNITLKEHNKRKKEKEKNNEEEESGEKEKPKYSKKETELRDLLAELKTEIKHKSKVAFTKKALEEFKLMSVPVSEIKKTALAHYAAKGEYAVVIAKLLLDYDGIVASLVGGSTGNNNSRGKVDSSTFENDSGVM